jgi:hypothetical protein
MNRMRLPFILLLGLTVCCWLIWRQSRRAAPFSDARDQRALDAWQESISLDPSTDYSSGRTPPELQEAESHQKPQEERN